MIMLKNILGETFNTQLPSTYKFCTFTVKGYPVGKVVMQISNCLFLYRRVSIQKVNILYFIVQSMCMFFLRCFNF